VRYWMLFNRFLMIAWRSSTPRAPMLSTAGVHVLLTLADGPRHGYAIMQTVVAESSGTVQFSRKPHGYAMFLVSCLALPRRSALLTRVMRPATGDR
jgi:hypothetical protein